MEYIDIKINTDVSNIDETYAMCQLSRNKSTIFLLNARNQV